MRASRAVLVAAVLLLPAATAVGEGDGAVTARLEWEPGTVGSAGSQSVTFDAAPPEGLPPLPGADVVYGSVAIGDVRPLLLAITAERIWVDTDMDGDLLDERGRTWTVSGTSRRHEASVLVPVSNDRVPVPVQIFFSRTSAEELGPITVSPRAYRVGEAVLAGRLRRVCLVDETGDMRFDDAKRDVFYVDVDGDGQFAAGHGTPEHFHFGAPIRVADAGFTVRTTDAVGTALEFVPAPAPEGIARKWKSSRYSGPGRAQLLPDESFAELRTRFEAERGGTYSERYQTVTAIGRTGDSDAVSFLLRVADEDDDTSLRSAAVRALGNPAFVESAGSRVIRIAKGGDQNAAAAAVQALYDMGHPDRHKLFVGLLDSSSTSVVGAAARYLAYEATDDGRDAVLRAAERASTPALRYQVYSAARALPGGPPPDLMARIARDDGYPSGQGQALQDMATIDHPDAPAVAHDLAAIRPVVRSVGLAVAKVLGPRNDTDSVDACVELGAAGDEEVRREVVRRLSTLRDEIGVGVLLKALKSRDESVRQLVAQVLAGIPLGPVTDALLARAARERDEAVSSALVEALGDHGDPRAVELLIRGAKQKKYALVRIAALRALALLGMELPEVREFFLKLLESKGWEDRIFAIDAAGASGDERLVPKILPNLSHDRRQVRLATAQALARLRSGQAVRPLIDRLGSEEVERVRAAMAYALFVTTGMNLYDAHDLWEQWWTDTGGNFKVPETVPTLPKADAGGTSASFYGIPVDSDRMTFVIDQSGSMSAADTSGLGSTTDDKDAQPRNRLDVAVREVLRLLGALPDGAYANVVLFHTTIHPWKDELVRLTRRTRPDLEKHLIKLKPTGGTNLYDGLETALLDREVDTVLLLSDGVPGSGKYVATEDILRAVRRLNQTRRIVIHCVSLGRESELMRRLAEENSGTYVRR